MRYVDMGRRNYFVKGYEPLGMPRSPLVIPPSQNIVIPASELPVIPAHEPESIKTSTKMIFNSHKIPDNPFGISGMTAATSHPSFRPHEPSSFRPPSRNDRHGRWKCDKGCCGPTFRNSPSLLTPAPEKSGKSSPPNTGAPSSMQQIPATSK